MIDGNIVNAINKGAEVIEDLLAYQIAANDLLLRAGKEIIDARSELYDERGLFGEWERPAIIAEIEVLIGETIWHE